MSRLAESTTTLVELLAAAGRPLWPEELRRLGSPTDADAVTSSEGLLVRREGRLGFRHELLRAAVYAGLADPAALHDRLADGIDPVEHVERAHHLALAGRGRECAAELAVAATRARDVGALDEAVELLQRAVEVHPEDGRLWLELEESCALAHRHHDMETAWAEALVAPARGGAPRRLVPPRPAVPHGHLPSRGVAARLPHGRETGHRLHRTARARRRPDRDGLGRRRGRVGRRLRAAAGRGVPAASTWARSCGPTPSRSRCKD